MAISRGAQKGRLEGMEKTLQFLKKLGDTSDEWSQAVLEQYARRVGAISQELVPVKTRALYNSQRIFSDGKDKWVIEYGIPDAPYAIYVHEVDYPHKHGTWKFLEKAVMQEHATLQSGVRQLTNQWFSAIDTGRNFLQSPANEQASLYATGVWPLRG